MTYNVDPKTGEVTLTADQLVSSQYDVGMQNKKMERQAIKGLSPKFCYAYSTDLTDCIIDNYAYLFFIDEAAHPLTILPTYGATYTHNGGVWTVRTTYRDLTGGWYVINFTGDGTFPTASGTLTKTSGTGDASIVFDTYQTLTNILPIDTIIETNDNRTAANINEWAVTIPAKGLWIVSAFAGTDLGLGGEDLTQFVRVGILRNGSKLLDPAQSELFDSRPVTNGACIISGTYELDQGDKIMLYAKSTDGAVSMLFIPVNLRVISYVLY